MKDASKIKTKYELAKNARVGENCVCPSCGTPFVKTSYQQVFCKTKSGSMCKDKYWNTVDERKRNNQTRISPANALWTLRKELQVGCKTRRTSEGYMVINGIAYDEFNQPVYNFDIGHADDDLGQWND